MVGIPVMSRAFEAALPTLEIQIVEVIMMVISVRSPAAIGLATKSFGNRGRNSVWCPAVEFL